ncbi:MAG: hypothetical protein ACLGG7_10385 [Bacteriovoracia bacterium]
MRRVTATQFEKKIPAPEAPIQSVSLSASSWSLVKKKSFSQRVYRLVLRDEKLQLIDNSTPPNIIIDGETKLSSVERISPGTWDVTLEFTTEQTITSVGLVLGDQRIERIKQIHFQIHDIDVIASRARTYKERVRADGIDELRVSVEIKDSSGYNIFSFDDLDLKVLTSRSSVKVSGPFSGHEGPFFRLTSLQSGPVDFAVTLDGEAISGGGRAQFVELDARRPAQQIDGCLENLAKLAERNIPKEKTLLEAYSELVYEVLRRYEEKADASETGFHRVFSALSSESCTEQRILDDAREEAGRSLTNVHRRLNP